MSDENQADGKRCYEEGDEETRAWFERQWTMWPRRADERHTTNLSFHYGGVLAFREANGRDPKMSRDFLSNVEWHDRHATR
jgi:hypothetical protein